MNLTTHLHLVLRLRMGGLNLCSPYTPSRCGHEQLYDYILCYSPQENTCIFLTNIILNNKIMKQILLVSWFLGFYTMCEVNLLHTLCKNSETRKQYLFHGETLKSRQILLIMRNQI
jgi:hypothetical protein